VNTRKYEYTFQGYDRYHNSTTMKYKQISIHTAESIPSGRDYIDNVRYTSSIKYEREPVFQIKSKTIRSPGKGC
jgi:hypothetical protein